MTEVNQLPEICKSKRRMSAEMVTEETYLKVRADTVKECEDTIGRMWNDEKE